MSKKIVFDYGNIFIKEKDFNEAFKSLKEALLKEHSSRTGNENRLLWIDIEKVKESTKLESLLHVCQWFPEFNLDNDIDVLKSRINLLGEDKFIFKALAPFIQDDSELIIYAEDESIGYREHRYSFKNGNMYFHNNKVETSLDLVQ